MTDEQNKLLQNFLQELRLCNMHESQAKFSIPLFFKYAKNHGVSYLSLSISDAQDFQTHLMTLTDNNGKIHYSKASVLNILSAVSGFYSYLKKKKIIYSNPFLGIKKVKRNRPLPRNIFNEEKMNKFLSHLKCFWEAKSFNEKRRLYRAQVISEVMYSTGIRINELVSLKQEDIDFERGLIRVKDTKTNVIRDAILNEYTLKVLKIYVEKTRDYIISKKKTC